MIRRICGSTPRGRASDGDVDLTVGVPEISEPGLLVVNVARERPEA